MCGQELLCDRAEFLLPAAIKVHKFFFENRFVGGLSNWDGAFNRVLGESVNEGYPHPSF